MRWNGNTVLRCRSSTYPINLRNAPDGLFVPAQPRRIFGSEGRRPTQSRRGPPHSFGAPIFSRSYRPPFCWRSDRPCCGPSEAFGCKDPTCSLMGASQVWCQPNIDREQPIMPALNYATCPGSIGFGFCNLSSSITCGFATPGTPCWPSADARCRLRWAARHRDRSGFCLR